MTHPNQDHPLISVLNRTLDRMRGDRLVRSWMAGPDESTPGVAKGGSPITVLAAGKAADTMARAVAEGYEAEISRGLVVSAEPGEPPSGRWRRIQAVHPVPDRSSHTAGQAALELVERVGADETLLALISGGASAMLCLPPPEVSIGAKAELTRHLLACPASIDEINLVRVHLSLVKGGGLARAFSGERCLVLLVSDVPGDDPAMVGSGPFAAQAGTFDGAREVLARYRLDGRVPAVDRYLRLGSEGLVPGPFVTTEERPGRVLHQVLAGNRGLLSAFAEEAGNDGWPVEIASEDLAPRAPAALGQIMEKTAQLGGAPGRRMVAMGGEPTVEVTGTGKGGRMQHLGMLIARELRGATTGVGVLCAASDGRDGGGEQAGALVDGSTWDRAAAAGLDPEDSLARCDSEAFHRAAGSAVRTGATGTNLRDLVAVFVSLLALLLAGCRGQRTLTSDQVRALFSGRTASGRHLKRGYRFRSYWEPSGVFRSYWNGGAKAYHGRWWVKPGGMICIRWRVGDEDLCRNITVDRQGGHRKVLFKPNGRRIVVIRYERFVDGNPHRL